jgi:hypothetical protein
MLDTSAPLVSTSTVTGLGASSDNGCRAGKDERWPRAACQKMENCGLGPEDCSAQAQLQYYNFNLGGWRAYATASTGHEVCRKG